MRRSVAIALVSLAAIATSAAVTPAAHAGNLKFFESPDHNIACAIYKGSKVRHLKGNIRCDMTTHTWVSPRPRNCEFDSGGGATLGEKGPGRGECVSDSIYNQGGVLPAGGSATKGRFTCTLDALGTGISCVNRRNHHGFAMTPATFSLF